MSTALKRYYEYLSADTKLRINRWRRPRALWLSLRRPQPISNSWGEDRGTAIDRHYIEQFLARNEDSIRGRCLEVKNANYTKSFGGDRIEASDVLDIDASNPVATVIGDLQQLTVVPDDTYDCFILTQVLQYIPDPFAAVDEVHRILKPGGTVLVTVPTVAPLDDHTKNNEYWRFTPASLRALFGRRFPADNLSVHVYGNALTSAAFLYGLALEELSHGVVDHIDADRPLGVAARAVKLLPAATRTH